MKQYVGTKVVCAEPTWRVQEMGKEPVVMPKGCGLPCYEKGTIIREGYKVVYEDGYESWSPKDVFEKAYRAVDGLSFGLAIEAAKKGRRIARAGWNGKNQYVELAEAICYKNASGEVVNAQHDAIGNRALAFVGTSGVQMGWLASQADMLADDWRIVD